MKYNTNRKRDKRDLTTVALDALYAFYVIMAQFRNPLKCLKGSFFLTQADIKPRLNQGFRYFWHFINYKQPMTAICKMSW